jgi:glycosyltransferase involved in cell wall biosynthesis
MSLPYDLRLRHALPDGPGRGLLSVVVPCFDEETVVETTHRRLVETLPETGMDFEIVYVDDGSRDATPDKLARIAAEDPRVRFVELSRNFGQQAAMSAGLAHAEGDAIVLIDADLQDPPEVIPEMVEAWRHGADVAYGRRRSRDGETAFKLATAAVFHRLLARLVPHPIPIDTGDFKLLDRAVVDALLSLPEKRRYLRNLVAWTGFRHEPVWYDRKPRAAGTTKYSIRKLLALAVDAVVMSSDTPMRLTWLLAAVLAVAAFASGTVAMLVPSARLPAGIGAIVSLVAAAQMVGIAIVGEYVVRTYRETQARPSWIARPSSARLKLHRADEIDEADDVLFARHAS